VLRSSSGRAAASRWWYPQTSMASLGGELTTNSMPESATGDLVHTTRLMTCPFAMPLITDFLQIYFQQYVLLHEFHPRRRMAGGFDGTEEPGDTIPVWVVEAVVRGRLPAKPEDKCAFILRPAEVRRALDCFTSGRVHCGPRCRPPFGPASWMLLVSTAAKAQLNTINTLVPAELHGVTAGNVLMLRALTCQRWIQLGSMRLPSCDAGRLRPTPWCGLCLS
jgi:hypothetical protein